MVKVRIEYNGQVKEFEKDAVIAFFLTKKAHIQCLRGKPTSKE